MYYAVSDNDGKTFSEPVALLSDEWVPYADVVMVVDEERVAWVAYEDRRGDVDQIKVARIDPDGDVVYSRAWPGNTPDMATGHGEVLVAWSAFAGEGEEDEGSGPIKLATLRPAGGDTAESARRNRE